MGVEVGDARVKAARRPHKLRHRCDSKSVNTPSEIGQLCASTCRTNIRRLQTEFVTSKLGPVGWFLPGPTKGRDRRPFSVSRNTGDRCLVSAGKLRVDRALNTLRLMLAQRFFVRRFRLFSRLRA